MAEGKRFFKWLLQEGSLNESIATELHERSKWKRTTINDARSFVVVVVLLLLLSVERLLSQLLRVYFWMVIP